MAVSGDKASIEREMEETRERMVSTIDQLVHRANPKTIVSRQIADIKAFFVDTQGQPRTENIAKVAAGVGGLVVTIVVVRRLTR